MQRDDRETAAPFIIWTLRRTGGTNLARHLFGLSPYRGIEHEPFNNNRVFGPVRDDVMTSGDTAPLDRICADGILIKHCVETVSPDFSRLLLDRSTAHGYRHLFLIRRAPADRLLSLHFARTSGAWGRRKVAQKSPEELGRIMRAAPIPIDDLIARERADRACLRSVYDRALETGTRPLIAVFEDLYDPDLPMAALARFRRLKAGLGIGTTPTGEADDREALFGGGQRTRDIYALAPNHDAFRGAMAELGPMTLGAAPPAPDPEHWAGFETHRGCKIDPPRLSWRADLVQITGTAPIPEAWQFQLADGTVLPMETGLSPGPGSTDSPSAFAVLDVPRAALAGARMVAR